VANIERNPANGAQRLGLSQTAKYQKFCAPPLAAAREIFVFFAVGLGYKRVLSFQQTEMFVGQEIKASCMDNGRCAHPEIRRQKVTVAATSTASTSLSGLAAGTVSGPAIEEGTNPYIYLTTSDKLVCWASAVTAATTINYLAFGGAFRCADC
jgi:hypothetical protein